MDEDTPNINEHFSSVIAEMEDAILLNLADVEPGYGRRKWAIAEQTGIPEDVLTVLLRRLRYTGRIKLITTWSETESLPDGSGYCLI